jgi:hypothetical protein
MYSIPQTIKYLESVTPVNIIAYISAQADSTGDASNLYKGGVWFKILTGTLLILTAVFFNVS